MNIKPLSDRIVIEKVKASQPSSLIVVPDGMGDTAPVQGKVIAVGPGKYDKGQLTPLTVKAGDVVAFPRNTGSVITVEKQEYIVMRENDILAILE